MSTIKLGDNVRDVITGFSGIAVGRHDYLHGCARFSVQPTELKDGKTIETQAFDEPQLEVIAGSVNVLEKIKKTVVTVVAKPGGPRDDPQRPGVPNRR